jgi:hypothetical protein
LNCGLMLAAIFALIPTGYANADSALNYIPSNGKITELVDDDWELLINRAGGGSNANASITSNNVSYANTLAGAASRTIDFGDIFVGMVRISYSQQPTGAGLIKDFDENGGFTLTSIFAIKVVAQTNPLLALAGYNYAAVSLSNSEWASVGLDALGFTRTSSDTIAIVYDDPNNASASTPSSPTTIGQDLQTVNGNRVWELGNGANTFWDVQSATSVPINGSLRSGTYVAGLDITHDYGIGPSLTPINHDYFGSDFAAVRPGSSQVLLGGNTFGPGGTGTTPRTSKFNALSHTTFAVQTGVLTPEPGSMVLLGMGALGFFGVGARRRRQAVKQQAV